MLSLMLLMGAHGFAAPGDTLYVRGNAVNMRKGPSTQHRIVLQLQEGSKLLELQRQGEWVKAKADRSGGTSGWVHASLVRTPESARGSTSDQATPSPSNVKFEIFKTAFNKATTRAQRKTGNTLFTKVEDLGPGVVQLTATDIWLAAPPSVRQRHLRAVFKLWGAAQGNELPIAVYVVDKDGKQRMSMRR
jgi:uncharacterized protein YgiM (DUF1202 family)